MKRICAWCKKELDPIEKFASEGHISHGICSFCALEVSSIAPRTAKKILSFISEPVFVIDGKGVVRAANSSASKMLSKELNTIEDQLGGDAFECTYAKDKGGCGNTVHCKTCTIRNIVMDTLKTGSGYKDVPAYQSINTPDGARILRFIISTEKVGEQILLRIEGVENVSSA